MARRWLELGTQPAARGVFLRRIVRGAIATTIPILPNTQVQRGDILTIVGRQQDVAAATKLLGVPDRVGDIADVAFIGGAITLGALIGALVLKVGGVPLTSPRAGGALICRPGIRLAPLGEADVRPYPVLDRSGS